MRPHDVKHQRSTAGHVHHPADASEQQERIQQCNAQLPSPLGQPYHGHERHQKRCLQSHSAPTVEAIRDHPADGPAEQQRRPHDGPSQLHHPWRAGDLVDVIARKERDRPASPVPAQPAEPQRGEAAGRECTAAADLGFEARRLSGRRPPAHQRGILREHAGRRTFLWPLRDQAGTPDAGAPDAGVTATGTPLTAALPDGTSTKSGGTSRL